jgi:hypothetical protein
MVRPARLTPFTSPTRIGTAPFVAVRVARPRPRTTVSDRRTFSELAAS